MFSGKQNKNNNKQKLGKRLDYAIGSFIFAFYSASF